MGSVRQTLANNLKYLMAGSSELETQQKLASRAGVGQPTIGRILRQESDAGISIVSSLAGAFKLSAQDLLDKGLIDRLTGEDSNIRSGGGLFAPVPLISWVVAGMLTENVDNLAMCEVQEWLQCPYAHSARAFCLQNKGLSMSPEYREDEVLLIDADVTPLHNSDVIVRTPGPDAKTTFRRLQVTQDGTFLMALNKDFPDRLIAMPSGSKILGTVTGSWMRRH
ncbi:LexA family protein [Pseudomonas sp. NPDC098747]|uniref:LexA family protein n=1 Tax=Pseudomonas sp. NPDC098747 TaxID=3364487 RepID=UPI00383B50B3